MLNVQKLWRRNIATMNPSLSEHWHHEVLQNSFDNIELVSFDIWAGLNPEEKHSSNFKNQEFEYMTLLYTTKSVSVAKVWEEPPPFLNHQDKNVERLVNSDVPIMYCMGLLEKEAHSVLEHFANQHNFLHPETFTILVPVDRSIEGRWKAALCLNLLIEPKHSISNFLYSYKDKLCQLANYIYRLWWALEGGDFNLYKVRNLLCQNALQIAELLTQGLSGKQIAQKLYITASGVEYHIDNLRQTFGATNRSQLIAELFRRGIVT